MTRKEGIPALATLARSASPRLAWIQVVLASFLMLATLPGRTQGLGLITEPLLADLQLDRLTYANLNLWATLLGALACFPAGWALDRIGLRPATAGIVLLLGSAVWGLSAAGPGVPLLFLLLLATRALGQSALSVCSVTLVGRWFARRVGMAMGVYSVLLSVFFAIGFLVVGSSVRANGWRTAWAQIAAALVFAVAPLVLLLLRETDSASSESADAPDVPPADPDTTARVAAAASVTFSQAIRTRAFWLFAGAGASFNLVSSGLGLFNEAVLRERGFDQQTFHHFLAVSTLMALIGQLLCGWLSNRWTFSRLTRSALICYALGLAGIPFIRTQLHLWLIAVLLGIAGGMVIVVFFSVWSDLFGQQHLGRIQGAAQMLTVLSSGIGPLLFAKSAEMFHSYAPLLFGLAGLVMILGWVAGRTSSPEPAKALSGPIYQ